MCHKAFVILLVQYFLLFAVNAEKIKQLKETEQDVSPNFQVIQEIIPVGETVGNCTSCPKNQENATKYLYIGDQTSEIEIPFKNPLPLGFILRDVRVDYVGVYNCDQEEYLTSVSVEVDETVVTGLYQLPAKNDSCVCISCHQRVPIPPDSMITNWWVGFNYSGENSLRIIFLHNTVAISKIILSFNTLDLNPNITVYEPVLAPTTNGGKMTILGSNFLPFFTYKCEFSQGDKVLFSITATPDDSGHVMTCPLPNYITPLNQSRNPVSFRFFPDTLQFAKIQFGSSTGPFPFEFYDQPKLSYITPTNGTVAGGTVVDIYGSGFFQNERLNCRFGYMATYATYHSPNHISCITPAVPDGNPVQVGVDISENGLSWTNNSIPFNFVVPPTVPIDVNPSGLLTPSQRTLMLIIGGAVLLVVLTAGSIAYFIHDQRCKNKHSGYSQIENFDSQLIVPMSEITMKEVIGRGSFGSVYRAYWRHTEVAVKKIDLDPTDALIAELYEEAKLMVSLRHPNVVNFMAVTAPPDVCIITEFVSRGSLYNILHDKRIQLELEHVRKLAIDTCKGMAYLHAARIIHRDLKTHNLLVDKSWNVKVCDFGLSRPIEDMNKTMTACGTPCWTAPEVLRSQRYSFKADVYSFGICLWEMLSREAPYGSMPPYQVVICVATKGMRPTIPSETPADFRRIVMESWDENPDKRPFFGDLLEDLEATNPPPAQSPNPVTTETAAGATPSPVASIGRNPSAGGLILKMNSPPPASSRGGSGAPSKSPSKPTTKKKSKRRPSDKKALVRSEPGQARSPTKSPSLAPPVQLRQVVQTETSSDSHDGTNTES